MSKRTRVVVIGAGFGGLQSTHHLLRRDDVDVVLIDRNNFHTFSPLLYQVATCGLDPSAIAYPIRTIFRKRDNVRFLMGEVNHIDPAAKQVTVRVNGSEQIEAYDYLIIAAGSVTNYFGNASLMDQAFGLKDLPDAIQLRNHILSLFERAAWTQDADLKAALTTFVVVGGGPTGLETAGALYELYNYVLKQEYELRGDELRARVILLEAQPQLLAPYPEALQNSAARQLKDLGVEVMLEAMVKSVEPGKVLLQDGRVIESHTLVWAAGVQGSPIAKMLGIPLQKGGRIPVDKSMRVTQFEGVYAVGDITYLLDKNGQSYPMVIPVAQQQGELVARNIQHDLLDEALEEFTYHDRGNMATIGRRRAVAWIYNRIQLTGFLAWLGWLFLHLIVLMGFRNRIAVFFNWVWNYITYDRSVRLILRLNPEEEKDKQTVEA